MSKFYSTSVGVAERIVSVVALCFEIKLHYHACLNSTYDAVFVKLECAFRYGREDLDVLGLVFRKDYCSIITQVR